MADCFDDTDMAVELAEPELEVVDDDVAEFTMSLKKKKKKKKPKKKKVVAVAKTDDKPGDAWIGSDRDYTYTELLDRVFDLLREKNPNLSKRKKYTMPPPTLVRVGTRKSMWTNFAQICQVMHRQQTHTQSFVLAELGTEGSLDGNQRLVLRGRYAPKHIESLLKKYIIEYVTCHMCKNPETTLTRDSLTRLYFVQCESCGSRRSVAPIKSGYHATNRADRRAAKAAAI